MQNILGTITTYHGSEHRYLRGYQVRIIAVIKKAARADHDPDAEDTYLTSEGFVELRSDAESNTEATGGFEPKRALSVSGELNTKMNDRFPLGQSLGGGQVLPKPLSNDFCCDSS